MLHFDTRLWRQLFVSWECNRRDLTLYIYTIINSTLVKILIGKTQKVTWCPPSCIYYFWCYRFPALPWVVESCIRSKYSTRSFIRDLLLHIYYKAQQISVLVTGLRLNIRVSVPHLNSESVSPDGTISTVADFMVSLFPIEQQRISLHSPPLFIPGLVP